MCKLIIQTSTLLWGRFKDNEYVFSPPSQKIGKNCKRNTVIQMCCLYAQINRYFSCEEKVREMTFVIYLADKGLHIKHHLLFC